MLALYIKAIEEVLLYLRALVTWGNLKKEGFNFQRHGTYSE